MSDQTKSARMAQINSGHFFDKTKLLRLDGLDDKGQPQLMLVAVPDPATFLGFLRRVFDQKEESTTSQSTAVYSVKSVSLSGYENPPSIKLSFIIDDGSLHSFLVGLPEGKTADFHKRFLQLFRDISLPETQH